MLYLKVIVLYQILHRLEKLGALEWDKIVHQNQAWRLITCIWLHAGVIHLLANMLSLVFIGIRLEQQFGFGKNFSWFFNKVPSTLSLNHAIWKSCGNQLFISLLFQYYNLSFSFLIRVCTVRVGVIYLLSGIGGSILSCLFIRNNISVGASGALFGLLGAMLSELFTNWTIYTNKVLT